MTASSELAVTLFAAEFHPDLSLRERLVWSIDEWVVKCGPHHSAEDLRSLLLAQRGTVIEPFVLSAASVDSAIRLARAAFSDAHECTRFRVVSEETLGNHGGCVLTAAGHAYLSERYALGKTKADVPSAWFLAPKVHPSAATLAKRRRQRSLAHCEVLSGGLQIKVGPTAAKALCGFEPRSGRHRQSVENAIASESVVGKEGITLASLGCRIERVGDGLVVRPTSPEATLRLSAHMAQREILILSGSNGEHGARMFVRLQSPSGPRTELQAISSLAPEVFSAWMSCSPSTVPDLDAADRMAIARWVGPLNSWVEEDFLEALL
jgi:hypothetical protein